jgi:hypothetical protein
MNIKTSFRCDDSILCEIEFFETGCNLIINSVEFRNIAPYQLDILRKKIDEVMSKGIKESCLAKEYKVWNAEKFIGNKVNTEITDDLRQMTREALQEEIIKLRKMIKIN